MKFKVLRQKDLKKLKNKEKDSYILRYSIFQILNKDKSELNII